MTFGMSIFPDNVGSPVSVDMAFPSYTAILKTGSKSAWQQVIAAAAVTADCRWLYVEINKTCVSATDTSAVLDIGVDPAGGTSYSVLVADLLAGHADDPNANVGGGGYVSYAIPIKITSGSSVAIRGQTVRGADADASVRVMLLGGATGTPFAGATVYTFGISGTGGTSITPGSGASWGSWTNIGSATAADIQAIVLGVQPVAGTTIVRESYQIEIGVSSASIGPIYDCHMVSVECMSTPRPDTPTYHFVASGAQLQVRSRASSDATPDAIRIALYGVSAT